MTAASTQGLRLDKDSGRADHYREVLRVRDQSEAREAVAAAPNGIAIVERGKPRSVVFLCPCNCGDLLSINVDRLAGKAWRLRVGTRGVTLIPSVWRISGCKSHFVLCRNRVWWCLAESDVDADHLPAKSRCEPGDA